MKRNNVCDVTSGRAGDRSKCMEVYEKIALLMFKTRAKQEGRALLYFSVCSEKLERLLRLQVRFSEVCTVYRTMSAEGPVVELTPADIPGANLSTPYEQHTVAALRWWLLCRGIQAPTSLRKKQLIDRCDYSIDTIHYSKTEFEQLF